MPNKNNSLEKIAVDKTEDFWNFCVEFFDRSASHDLCRSNFKIVFEKRILRERLLRCFPNTKFNDEAISFDDDGLIAFLNNIERAIIGFESINEKVLSALPKLSIISKYGVGTDVLTCMHFNVMALNSVAVLA